MSDGSDNHLAFDAFELTFNVFELAFNVFELTFDVFELAFDGFELAFNVFELMFDAFEQTLGVTASARRDFGLRLMMIRPRSIAQRPQTSLMKRFTMYH